MTSQLLVPLDGSEIGESAVPWAVFLAQTQGHTLVLAQAIPWPVVASDGMMGGFVPANVYEEIIDAERQVATEYLNGVRDRLAGQGLHAEVVVRDGSPYAVLPDLADELGAEAIVMATHGRGGIERALLGSVANSMVQQATIPVLLVRADGEAASRPPALDRLLVPLDGSALAEHALDYAVEIAQPGSTAVLLRVEESAPARRDEDGAATYLDALAETLRSKGLHIATDARRGRASDQILEAARAHDADLIVMATHGRSGPARWLLGSVADEVVRHADRPVLLVSARVAVGRAAEPYTIGDLLTAGPVVVREDESLAVVLRKLLRQRAGGVCVIDESGALVGVVSERELTDWHDLVVSDLARQASPPPDAYARRLLGDTAASIMSRTTQTLDASTPLAQATRLFRERGIARIVVLRDGTLAGVLTRGDILKAMAARLRATAGLASVAD